LQVAARDLLRAVADGDPLALRMATDLAATVLSLDVDRAEVTDAPAVVRGGRRGK
jgi:hypothetical protein